MAELALAIVGVAVPVFQNCVAAIHFILDVKHADDDQKSLLLSLRLQETTFYTWGEQAGLVVYENDSGEKRVKTASSFTQSQTLVLELLAETQHIFHKFREHELRRLKIDWHTKKATHRTEEGTERFVQSSEDAGETPPKKRRWLKDVLSNISEKTEHGWRCLQLASWDKGELEKLIGRFKTLNDSMTGLLDSQLQKQIATTTQETYRVALQMASTVEQIQFFIDATRFAQDSSQRNSELERYGKLAEFKKFEGQNQTKETTLIIQPTAVEEKPDNGYNCYRSEGFYKNPKKGRQNIWIEWRDYQPFVPASCQDDRADPPAPPEIILKSVKGLARLLNHVEKPTEFRVPHCLGYFENRRRHRIGFVFQPPGQETSLPTTLLELIRGPAARPGIMGRIALAKALASSLMYLHTVDWIHKALRSDNILFFDKDDSGQVVIKNPMISGFDLARPVKNKEYTRAPDRDIDSRMYRHPSSLLKDERRPPYCKTFDIYSLGIILVELALWKPIDEILTDFDVDHLISTNPEDEECLTRFKAERQMSKVPSTDILKKDPFQKLIFNKVYATTHPHMQMAIRAKLLRGGKPGILDATRLEMGPVYSDVARACLEGGKKMGAAEDAPWTTPEGDSDDGGRVKTALEQESSLKDGVRVAMKATEITKAYIETVVRPLEGIKI